MRKEISEADKADEGDESGQGSLENHYDPAAPSPLADTIAQLKGLHRERCFFMEQRKRQYLALGAYLRSALGWSLAMPVKERNAIAKRAQQMIADGEGEWCDIIGLVTEAAKPFEIQEKQATSVMSKTAPLLPVWEAWGKAIRGFGPMSLAIIVAEAGDLSNYPTISKLWKRMGVAVMGDVRQGGLRKNAAKEDWIAHGYNAKRRSKLWNIGDALIKGNREGEYRTLYLKQKEVYLERGWTKLHAHRAAQRYMEKKLLKHLWHAWRAIHGMQTKAFLPASLPDENRASGNVPSMAKVAVPNPHQKTEDDEYVDACAQSATDWAEKFIGLPTNRAA